MNRRELLQLALAAPFVPLATMVPIAPPAWVGWTNADLDSRWTRIEGIKRIWMEGRLIYDADNPT